MKCFQVCRFGLLTAALLFILSLSVSAQQSIIPLKQGDYKVVDEDLSYSPNASFSGYYFINGNAHKEGAFSGTVLQNNMAQDVQLKIRSKINTNVSLNLTLGNASTDLSDQDYGYKTSNSSEEDSTNLGNNGLNIVFTEAYVEYNHNPNVRLLVGLQPITVGDSNGLIYEGNEIAVTQHCGIGTWCYEIGGARFGDNGGQGLMWLQLEYPFYESGIKINDKWAENNERDDVALKFQISRTSLQGNHLPLGEYGGWTGDQSTYHEIENSNYVYFDYDKTEYLGLISKVYYHEWDFNFTWIGLGGNRDYYTSAENLGSKRVIGHAGFLDVGYKFRDDLKLSSRLFSASGNSYDSTDTDEWDANSSAFYEAQKGSYGDALIYFNSDYGIGRGHSVSNLTYGSISLSYRPESEVSMDVGFYAFFNTNPIMVQYSGESARSVSDIGLELDYTVNYQLEKNLLFSAQIAFFSVGDAYRDNDNDNIINDDPKESFTMIALSCKYQF